MSQLDKFKEAARELETDDSEEAFDAKPKKVSLPKRKALLPHPLDGIVRSAMSGAMPIR